MARIRIIGAGHGFSLNHEAYRRLKHFGDKTLLFGVKAKIAHPIQDIAIGLYIQCEHYTQPGDYIIIINDGNSPPGNICHMLFELYNLKIQKNRQVSQQIEQEKKKYRDVPPELLEQLSMLPASAIPIKNPIGIEPGYILDIRERLFFFLPCLPEELFSMLDECVLPILADLSERKMAVETVMTAGLTNIALEVLLDKLFQKEDMPVHYELLPRENSIEIKLTAFAGSEEEAAATAARSAKLVRDGLWLNIPEEYDHELTETLTGILRDKKITVAAAVTDKDLTREFASGFIGVFHYVFNAAPLSVQEMVFEVPRSFFHDNEGVNRKAAMYMAHSITRLCKTDVGFVLAVKPDGARAIMAISAAGKITCREFDRPGDADGKEKARFAMKNAAHFCKIILENYPANIPDAILADDFMNESLKSYTAAGFQ